MIHFIKHTFNRKSKRRRKSKCIDPNFPFSLCWNVAACHAPKLLGVCTFPGDWLLQPTCPFTATTHSIQIQPQNLQICISPSLPSIWISKIWTFGFLRFSNSNFKSIFFNFWLHCTCMSVPNHNRSNPNQSCLNSVKCFRIDCMWFSLLSVPYFFVKNCYNPNNPVFKRDFPITFRIVSLGGKEQ